MDKNFSYMLVSTVLRTILINENKLILASKERQLVSKLRDRDENN